MSEQHVFSVFSLNTGENQTLEMVRGDKEHRPGQKKDRRGNNGERKGKADKNEMREVEHRGKGEMGRILQQALICGTRLYCKDNCNSPITVEESCNYTMSGGLSCYISSFLYSG